MNIEKNNLLLKLERKYRPVRHVVDLDRKPDSRIVFNYNGKIKSTSSLFPKGDDIFKYIPLDKRIMVQKMMRQASLEKPNTFKINFNLPDQVLPMFCHLFLNMKNIVKGKQIDLINNRLHRITKPPTWKRPDALWSVLGWKMENAVTKSDFYRTKVL